MRSVGLFLAFITLGLCASIACAQGSTGAKPVVIVGVAAPANTSRAVFNGNFERDQMVRDINDQSARDKKSQVKIQAVALDGVTMDEVASQLKEKNCQYVVLTTASEQIGVASFDSAAGIPDPMKPPPDNSPGAAKVLGVKYSISRVAEPGVVSHGAMLAEGAGDGFGQSAIDGTFRQTAIRVWNEVRRLKPPPVN